MLLINSSINYSSFLIKTPHPRVNYHSNLFDIWINIISRLFNNHIYVIIQDYFTINSISSFNNSLTTRITISTNLSILEPISFINVSQQPTNIYNHVFHKKLIIVKHIYIAILLPNFNFMSPFNK